jgi:hypothetical protein
MNTCGRNPSRSAVHLFLYENKEGYKKPLTFKHLSIQIIIIRLYRHSKVFNGFGCGVLIMEN